MIHVAEQVPVAFVESGSSRQLVDADGAFLSNSTPVRGALPVVPVSSAQGNGSVSAPGARAAVTVLAAAPYALLSHIASATSSSQHGVIVQLRHGPQLYFGPSGQLPQKWAAAVAVLQNSDSVGASYIDVTDPGRPASGAASPRRRRQRLVWRRPAHPRPQAPQEPPEIRLLLEAKPLLEG